MEKGKLKQTKLDQLEELKNKSTIEYIKELKGGVKYNKVASVYFGVFAGVALLGSLGIFFPTLIKAIVAAKPFTEMLIILVAQGISLLPAAIATTFSMKAAKELKIYESFLEKENKKSVKLNLEHKGIGNARFIENEKASENVINKANEMKKVKVNNVEIESSKEDERSI